MKNATYKVDVDDILDRVFLYLVKNGLENVTIRDLCRATGIVQGKIYYWFGDKTMIICEATEFGLKKVTDEIFEYVFSKLDNLDLFFSECLEGINRYREELRFIYQMAASPIYGDKIRSDGKYFREMYDEYAKRLAVVLNCDSEKLKPVVYLFVSAVSDYVIWEDRVNSQAEIDFIHSVLNGLIGIE